MLWRKSLHKHRLTISNLLAKLNAERMLLLPHPFSERPAYLWSRTSRKRALVAESSLLDHLKDKQLKHVDIGKNRFINTLTLNSNQSQSVVLTHGYAAGLGFFYRNYSALSSLNYNVYSMDWLGMANSSRPKFPKAKKKSIIDDAIQAESFFIDSLEDWRIAHNISKMTLVGHSLGGYLNCCYALKFPHRVEKLILVSPVPKAPNQESRSGVLRHLWNWNVTPMLVLRLLGPMGSYILKTYTGRRFAHLDPNEMLKLHDYIYHISAQTGSGEYALNRLLLPGAWAKYPLYDRIHDLQMPVTFIYGTHDWMDFRGALTVVDKIKNRCKIVLIENAGHHLYLDNPEAFNASLINEIRNQDVVAEVQSTYSMERNESLESLSEQWVELRSIRGHYQDGEYNSAVDGFDGKKHQVMKKLQKMLTYSSSADIISALGSPDHVGETIDVNQSPLMMPGPVIPSDVNTQTGPMLVSGPVYLVYYWRGKHDYLWFKVQSETGQAVDSGWYNALE